MERAICGVCTEEQGRLIYHVGSAEGHGAEHTTSVQPVGSLHQPVCSCGTVGGLYEVRDDALAVLAGGIHREVDR